MHGEVVVEICHESAAGLALATGPDYVRDADSISMLLQAQAILHRKHPII